MDAVPYSLVKGRDLEALRALVQQSADRWTAAWGTATSCEVMCERAPEWRHADAPGHWNILNQAGDRMQWLHWSPAALEELQHCLFSGSQSRTNRCAPSASVAMDVARDALHDLCTALQAIIGGGAPDSPSAASRVPQSAWRRGSGAVIVVLAMGNFKLHCLLNHAAVTHVLQSPAWQKQGLAPTNLNRIFGQEPIRLTVRLGNADLTLAQLSTLAKDDVILVSSPVNQPLAVYAPDGSVVCQCHLGRKNGKAAIETIRPNAR